MNEPQTKKCQNCGGSFVIEPDDFAFYEKIDVPPPTFCPECRMVRRMTWRNERSLYHRDCVLCKKPIIGMYAPESPYAVTCRECWYGDAWDPLSYGSAYDWQRPFFVQWSELLQRTPIFNLQTVRQNVSSDYINFASGNKDCYLDFSVVGSESVAYSFAADNDKDCFDTFAVKRSELCYENIDGSANYQSHYLVSCSNCLSSSFLFDCVNCQSCFMSANLRNKQYVFRNVQLSKEEYERRVAEIDFGSYAASRALVTEFLCMVEAHALHRYAHVLNSSRCIGDHIVDSKDARYVFGGYELENVSYAARSFSTKDSRDGYGIAKGNLLYESFALGYEGNDTAFTYFTDAPRTFRYCCHCYSGSNLFACVGLRNKQYCILNKQYSKEEYEALVPRIKKHMDEMPYIDQKGREYKYGEFFPPELSPFAYNETIAQEYFPLTKEEALSQGFRWRDPDTKEYKVTKRPADLPDHIRDVTDEILKETIGCMHGGACNQQCAGAFRIIPQELSFYRRMNLPLPRLCPNCRHYERLAQRNPLKLWHRQCMCDKTTHQHGDTPCTEEFETSYAPERKEIVYCESCYNAEVV